MRALEPISKPAISTFSNLAARDVFPTPGLP
nr:MAG TPA: hypothetical protein [Caudoviricetes sp.]